VPHNTEIISSVNSHDNRISYRITSYLILRAAIFCGCFNFVLKKHINGW